MFISLYPMVITHFSFLLTTACAAIAPCLYAGFRVKWFQRNTPQRLTDAGESATIKAQKGILPIDGQPKFNYLKKKVTVSLAGAVTFLCLCMQSELIR